MSKSLTSSSFDKIGLVSIIIEQTVNAKEIILDHTEIKSLAKNSPLLSLSRVELQRMATVSKGKGPSIKTSKGTLTFPSLSWGYFSVYQNGN